MLTILIIFVLTVIIAKCFYKSNFDQNKLIVILIAGGLSFITLLIVNFSVRNKLPIETTINRTIEIKQFNDSIMYLTDTLNHDTISVNVFNKLDSIAQQIFLENCDTVERYKDTSYWFYKNHYEYVFLKESDNKRYIDTMKIYSIEDSYKDTTIGYINVCFDNYRTNGNKWLIEASFSRKNRFFKIYLPNYVTKIDSLSLNDVKNEK